MESGQLDEGFQFLTMIMDVVGLLKLHHFLKSWKAVLHAELCGELYIQPAIVNILPTKIIEKDKDS